MVGGGGASFPLVPHRNRFSSVLALVGAATVAVEESTAFPQRDLRLRGTVSSVVVADSEAATAELVVDSKRLT